MMNQEDKKVLDEFARRVRSAFAEARIWAFGSRARGKAEMDSDFDICIVVERVDEHVDRIIRNIAWEVGFENDRVITTVVIEKRDFEIGPMSESTLVSNILREGIAA